MRQAIKESVGLSVGCVYPLTLLVMQSIFPQTRDSLTILLPMKKCLLGGDWSSEIRPRSTSIRVCFRPVDENMHLTTYTGHTRSGQTVLPRPFISPRVLVTVYCKLAYYCHGYKTPTASTQPHPKPIDYVSMRILRLRFP